MLLDGKLYRGAHSLAGEIGHMSIDVDGVVSPTGRGGLEMYIGNRRLADRAAAALAADTASSLRDRAGKDFSGLTVKMIAEEAARGDALSVEIFDFAAKCLATALASLTYVLQPQAFIVGGGRLPQRGNLVRSPAEAPGGAAQPGLPGTAGGHPGQAGQQRRHDRLRLPGPHRVARPRPSPRASSREKVDIFRNP